MTAKRRRFQGKSLIDFTKDGRVIPYREMYYKLPPRERTRINEKAIFGVIQLGKEEFREGKVRIITLPGTGTFLQGRLRRLIRETKTGKNRKTRDGSFTKAAHRFQDAVRGFKRERPGFYRPG